MNLAERRGVPVGGGAQQLPGAPPQRTSSAAAQVARRCAAHRALASWPRARSAPASVRGYALPRRRALLPVVARPSSSALSAIISSPCAAVAANPARRGGRGAEGRAGVRRPRSTALRVLGRPPASRAGWPCGALRAAPPGLLHAVNPRHSTAMLTCLASRACRTFRCST